jgi:hypothetical protein
MICNNSTSRYAAISTELRGVLSSLFELARQQQRGGLVPPDENVEARLRDLATAVLEKAPRAASRNLVDIRTQLVGEKIGITQ